MQTAAAALVGAMCMSIASVPAFEVRTTGGTYPVVVGHGVLPTLPSALESVCLSGRLWLVADAAVYPRYGVPLEAALRAAGRDVHSCTIPSGEASKTLE